MPSDEGLHDTGSDEKKARSGALVWRETVSITASIRATFSESLQHVHQMVKLAPENPEKAVHSYRKTIRRLRAFVKLLRDLYSNTRCRVRSEYLYGDWFSVACGVRQGSVGGPVLANTRMDCMMRDVRRRCPHWE